jgi:hypothetical protein
VLAVQVDSGSVDVERVEGFRFGSVNPSGCASPASLIRVGNWFGSPVPGTVTSKLAIGESHTDFDRLSAKFQARRTIHLAHGELGDGFVVHPRGSERFRQAVPLNEFGDMRVG